MTIRAGSVLGQLVVWAEREADGSRCRRVAARWGASRPGLAGFASVGTLVRSAWTDPSLAATVIAELAVLSAAGDGLAAQAAVAVLAPRLLAIVARWSRAGVPAGELEDMAAELVVEVLALLRRSPDPGSPGQVVDLAWGRVRARRRRERRAASRRVCLDPVAPAASTLPTTDDRAWAAAAGVVVDGLRSGRLSLPAAQALWLTGVAGFGSREAAARLGCRPEALRARRSRAIRALAA